jgi:hypothetical protein
MTPSPDDAATGPHAAAPAEPPAPSETPAAATASPPAAAPTEDTRESAAADGGLGNATAPHAEATAAPSEPEKAPAKPAATRPPEPDENYPREPPPNRVLLYTVFSLLCMGIALWLVLAWAGYKDKYSQTNEGWRLGSTRMLEITLIREDKKNLACASDRRFGEIHCAYARDGKFLGTKPDDSPHILQPFNTVKNELFLAAGLWQSPVLKEPLPTERFTVVCNYHVVGVLKAVALRWSPTGSFNPVDQSVAVGALSECVIPQ